MNSLCVTLRLISFSSLFLTENVAVFVEVLRERSLFLAANAELSQWSVELVGVFQCGALRVFSLHFSAVRFFTVVFVVPKRYINSEKGCHEKMRYKGVTQPGLNRIYGVGTKKTMNQGIR